MPATWGKNTLTNQALTMMNQALGISAITFTKAVTITDDITGDSASQLQALTSVNYKQLRTPKAIATQDNKSRLGVTIDNSDVNEDYIYYGVGLYAKQNSTNQEVLFSVIPLTAGATMIAKENNAITASIYLDLYTDIVRGTQVTIMVSNSGTLSREDVQQMISQSIGNALNYPNETASTGTDFNAILDISITRIIKDTTVVNAPSGFSGTGYLTTIGSGDKTVPIMQTLDDTINNIRSTRYFNSTTNVWSEWNAYAKTVDVNQQLDKKVNVADMRKPASDVAGIEDITTAYNRGGIADGTDAQSISKEGLYQLNGISLINFIGSGKLWGTFQVIYQGGAIFQIARMADGSIYTNSYGGTPVSWGGWIKLADDSKVAHLSGANNFDTVPTVKNNPLLLASSLPSDLARTGSDQEFTGKNIFDTAPIDKTTGNPYITAKTPGIPKLAVTYNATSKAFDYTLTAPEKDGLSDIIQYNLLWKDHSVDDWTTVIVKPDGLTGQLTGVDITKTYDFKAAAQNAVGSSGFADVITLGTAAVPGIPSLTVEYNAGKKGFDYTVTAPESDGGSEITGYSLEYQNQGGTDWTKVALNPDSLTGTVTDGIEAGSNYLFRVNAENAVGSSDYFTVSDPLPTVDGNIYGVSWDGSSSGALKRTDAAVGLKAGINGAQNDFDTRGPWGLMDKTVTDSYGNAFVRVPKFYIRKTQDKSKPLSTWQVSLVKQGDDWYLPNCFYDFGNKKELDYVDVSRYEGFIESGHLKSKSGVNPTSSVDINDFRTAATALNAGGKKGYHLWDVHTLDALQVLFTIEFATLDSQSIMEGNDNSSSAISNGTTDNVKGSSGFAARGSAPMTYRGIENLYGNLTMWTDGLNISNLSLYACDDATKYASDVFTSPYYKLNYSLQSLTSGNSNITGLGFDKDHPSVEAPTSSNNDQYNTYYHDYCYVNGSGNYVVETGGSWAWRAGVSGLWCWFGSYSSTSAYSGIGSRLLKKAL